MISLALLSTLAALGVVGGFFAGLLGFGGGVMMFPLLYYIPPLLGLSRLDANTVAAVVISQVFFSTIIGGVAHLRQRRVHRPIVLGAGPASAIGSFAGAVLSAKVSEDLLLALFGIITVLVLGMMFLSVPSQAQEDLPREHLMVALLPLTLYSLAVGVLIGFLGAGNFVFVPLLIYVLKVPTRIAIGSSLFIAMMNTSSGFLGKLLTGQIPLLLASSVIVGAAIGALIGEKLHSKISTRTLRQIYAVLVALIAARVWMTLLGFDT
jgi:uncharacterized membrane protein YfcA